jgi:uncharacterized SAM-binding protein YcdF (DUF218 family)
MKWIGIGIIVGIVGLAAFLGYYLAPDDLSQCSERPSSMTGCQKVDAIVAISGGDTMARTTEAVGLFKNDWASQLVFSGAAQDSSGPSNAEAMRRQAVAMGVPNDAIIVEETARSTAENAEQTEALFVERGIKEVILVTSAYHQRRASLEFTKRVDSTVKILNHPVATDHQWSRLWWITPGGWWLAIGEMAKIIAFYLGSSR